MNSKLAQLQHQTRRHFLSSSGVGLGAIALSSLNGGLAQADIPIDPTTPLQGRKPHFDAKAKRVIYLHLTGSPPNLDIYDYKPELVKRTGQDCPDEFLKGRTFAFTSGVPKLLGTPRTFTQHGQSGTWLSDAVPNFHRVADDMCFIHSMNTDQFNHAPAELLIYTGSPMDWERKTRTCQDLWFSSAAVSSRMAERTPTAADSCHPCFRESNVVPRVTRSCTFRIPLVWIVRFAADRWML